MAAKRTAPAPEPGQTLSFEQALERLETIVEELENGSLSLEQSIARYEEGVKLSRQLGKTLDEADKRIERLTADSDGNTTTEPMSLDDDNPGEAPAPRRTPSGSGGPPELPF